MPFFLVIVIVIVNYPTLHITHDSDTTFKVKGQLVADVLNSPHAGTEAIW